ncbi:hypothetical protein AB833_08430 [Chromatiales bacterium (ex Bugula neritina AB1)]|nr:hypothetical protein AB833_08430 [Chromatiales bacterium (ex Bugula neritina AB1)]
MIKPEVNAEIDIHGVTRSDLEARGQIIGPDDLHIASHTKEANLPLITSNLKEFAQIEDL